MTALEKLVADVLSLPQHDVDDRTGPATHASWTSMRHLEIVAAVDETYGIRLTAREARSVRSVGDLRRLLLNKGAAL